MKLKLQTWRSIAIIAILLAIPASVRADAVADWNAIAVQATVTAARPAATGVLDVAMMQAAIYDAVQAIEKRYEPYYVEIPGASGSPEAAAAKAAHDVLVSRFPAQAAALDATYQQYLLSHGLSETDPGVAVGAKAAAGIIALRACDGSFPNPRSAALRRRHRHWRLAPDAHGLCADGRAVVGQRHAFHPHKTFTVPRRAAARSDQPRVRQRLQRG